MIPPRATATLTRGDDPINNIDPTGRLSLVQNGIVGLYGLATFTVAAVPVGIAFGAVWGAAAGGIAAACMTNGLANAFNGESFASGCSDGAQQSVWLFGGAALYEWLGG